MCVFLKGEDGESAKEKKPAGEETFLGCGWMDESDERWSRK
jgi:hypothetical protein